MNLSELPQHIRESIRGVRVISTQHLGKLQKGPGGRNLCYWCRTEVSGRRQNWCSDACIDKFTSLRDLPKWIPERDNYRCVLCDEDLHKLSERQQQLYWLQHRVQTIEARIKHFGEQEGATTEKLNSLRDELDRAKALYPDMFGKAGRVIPRVYEVDHIIPVFLGGTTTSENLRTLCVVCHHHKSAQDMKQISAHRRARRK